MSQYIELYNDNGSKFNLNCTSFTVEDLEFLNQLRNITAILCSVITLAILIFLIFSKAFSSLLKRLYFYLIVGTLFTEIVLGLNIEHLWHYKGQQSICILLGFLTQWTYVMVFILSCEVVLHLLCIVFSRLRGSQPFPKCTGAKLCTRTVEAMYILLPLTIATVFAVMPLLNNGYGIAGPWCWVQSINEECEPSGLIIQMIFYGMYMVAGVAGIGASLFFVVYFKMSSSFRNLRSLLKKTLYVMIFQIIHILIILCNLTLRAYTVLTQRHQLYGWWVAHAFTLPVGVLVFPIGYLISFYSAKKTVVKIVKNLAFKCCKHGAFNRLHSDHELFELKDATAPDSDRISPPSDTYFDPLHPDNSGSSI